MEVVDTSDNTSHSLSSNLPSITSDEKIPLTHAPDTSIDSKDVPDVEAVVTVNNMSQNESAPGEKWNSLKISSRRGSQDLKRGQGKAQHSSSSSDENDSQRKYRSPSRSRDGSPASHVSRRAAARNSPAGSKNSSLERKVHAGSLESRGSPAGSKKSSLERKNVLSERKNSPAGSLERRNSPAGSKKSSLERKVVSLERKSSPAGSKNSSLEGKVDSKDSKRSPAGSRNSSFERKLETSEHRNSPAGSRSSSSEGKVGSAEHRNSPVAAGPNNSSLERKMVSSERNSPVRSKSSSPEHKGSKNTSLERKTDSSKRRDASPSSKNTFSERKSKRNNQSIAGTISMPGDKKAQNQEHPSSHKILAELSAQSQSISVNYSSSYMPSEERASSLQATAGSNSRLNTVQTEKDKTHAERVQEILGENGDEEPEFKGYLDINGMYKDIEPVESLQKVSSATNMMPRLASAVSLPSSDNKSNLRRRTNNLDNRSKEAEVNSDDDNLNTLSGIGSIEDEKDLVYSIRLINSNDKGVEGDNEDDDIDTATSDVKCGDVSSELADQSSITATEGDEEFRKGGKWPDDYGCLTAMKWIMCPCADA